MPHLGRGRRLGAVIWGKQPPFLDHMPIGSQWQCAPSRQRFNKHKFCTLSQGQTCSASAISPKWKIWGSKSGTNKFHADRDEGQPLSLHHGQRGEASSVHTVRSRSFQDGVHKVRRCSYIASCLSFIQSLPALFVHIYPGIIVVPASIAFAYKRSNIYRQQTPDLQYTSFTSYGFDQHPSTPI
jgi:hypothetical protein